MVELSFTISMPTTSLPFCKSIPLTPLAVLPMSLTSSSLNLMPSPFFVPMSISFLPSVRPTATRLSPLSIDTAMMPPALGLLNAESAVFFITPIFVHITTYLPSSNFETGSMVVSFSSVESWRRLIIAFPFACLPASGTSYTLSQYTLPLFVKNRR